MRIGVIGVGRIGAVHAETLHALAEVDELVLVDADTGLGCRQLASEMGVAWAQDSDQLFNRGADGIVIATPTGTHAASYLRRRRGRGRRFLRKAGRRRRGRHERGRPCGGKRRRPGTDRLPATLRRRLCLRRSGTGGQAGVVAHRPGGHAGPRPSAGCVRRFLGRDIPGLQRPRHRRRALGDRAGGERGLRHRLQPGRQLFQRSGRRRYGRRPGSPWTTVAWPLSPQPAITRPATTSAWNCWARRTAFRWAWTTACRCARPSPGRPGRRVPPTADFLDRFRAAYVAELQAFVDVVSGRATSACSPADALETFYVAEACELSSPGAASRDDGGGTALTTARIAAAPISWGSVRSPVGVTSFPGNGC